MNYRNINLDFWNFMNTAKAMNGVLNNAAVVTATIQHAGDAATIAITAHGYVAGSRVYIQGTTNYGGIARVHAVPTANGITIPRKFVAETPAGTEGYFPGLSYPTTFALVGFKLHLSAAGTTDEDFEVSIDSNVSSYLDTKIYDHTVQSVQDIIYFPDHPVICEGGDIIKCTWANTDALNWGLTLVAARLV